MIPKQFKKLFNALILSIPLLVMLSLALMTWWLVLLTPEMPDFSKVKRVSDGSDLIVYDFVLHRFDKTGSLRTDMTANKAERFLARDEILVNNVGLITTETLQNTGKAQLAINESGAEFFTVTATADRSILHNSQSMIELLDNAYVTRQPYEQKGDAEKIEFWGDELKIFLEDGSMVSEKPVDISQDGTRFTADAMTYDYEKNTFELRGRVVGDSMLKK